MCMLSRSVVLDSAILRTAARQAPQAMGFPRQEYCSGLPFPPPADLPVSPSLAGGFVSTESPRKLKGKWYRGKKNKKLKQMRLY